MDADTREKAFYKALGTVPVVPASVFESVERGVRRSGVKRRAMLAACLLLAFIIPTTLFVFTASNKGATYADERSMDELLYAFEFLSGGGDDGGYRLLDETSADDSVAASGARQQQASMPPEELLTKKSQEKGLSNEK
jgi:hypothetical protein